MKTTIYPSDIASCAKSPPKKPALKNTKNAHGRVVFERFAFIARKLRKGLKVNASTIAAEFEVTIKTAQRDMDFLRDRLYYDVDFDQRELTYRLISAPEPKI